MLMVISMLFTVIAPTVVSANEPDSVVSAPGGSNSESGAISFTNLVYTHESLGGAASKTFRYWIMEANAGAGSNGVTYDTTRYLYQVTLSRDAYGRLVAEEAYFALANGGNAENAASYTVPVTTAAFTNTYASATHLNLVAGKVLTGRAPGAAMDFGALLIEAMKDAETADRVRGGMVYRH